MQSQTFMQIYLQVPFKMPLSGLKLPQMIYPVQGDMKSPCRGRGGFVGDVIVSWWSDGFGLGAAAP